MLNGMNGMTKKYRQLERKNDEVDKYNKKALHQLLTTAKKCTREI